MDQIIKNAITDSSAITVKIIAEQDIKKIISTALHSGSTVDTVF